MRIIRYIVSASVIVMLLAGTAVMPAAAQQSAGAKNDRITMNFKDAAIKDAIDTLFAGSGQNYILEPGVQGTVNVKLVDIPFADALSAVLKASNLTMRKDKGVYIIGPQKEAPPVVLAPPPTVVKEPVKAAPKKIVIKIPVGYADAFDIGSFFGVTGVRSSAASVASGSGGTTGSSSVFSGISSGTGTSGRSSSSSRSSSSRSSSSSSSRF